MNTLTEKRLLNEIKDLKKNKLDFVQAIQSDENKFVFYFLLKGDIDTDYKNGYYIGKIMLPNDYPQKAGDYMMLTPNGRFEINKKICLTNSGFHTDEWSPIWNIRTMLAGFNSIFVTDLDNGISHIKDTPENRKKYAKQSVEYNLTNHFNIFSCFNQFINEDGTIKQKKTLINIKFLYPSLKNL